MHLVFELIASMNAEEFDKTPIKTEKRNRNEENRRQIIDFIADNGISDSKSILKAVGLRSSGTRYYFNTVCGQDWIYRPTATLKISQLPHQNLFN